MKPPSYWQQRTQQIARRQFSSVDQYAVELAREYNRARRTIQREIVVFYERYADNNVVTMAEARKLLTAPEVHEFKMKLVEFTRKGKDNLDSLWTQMLSNVYCRTTLSRYEALQTLIRNQIELLAGERQAGGRGLLGVIYIDTYHRTLYEVHKGSGLGVSFAQIDDRQLAKVLRTEFAGGNWSDRICADRDKLATGLQTMLTQGFIRGHSIDRIARNVAERMGVSYTNAQRLVQIEAAFFMQQATADGYRASGIDGETYFVPRDITYPEWKRQFVDGESAPAATVAAKLIPVVAKAVKEAEEYATQHLGFSKVSYRDLDVEAANTLNQAVAKAYNKFPSLKGFATELATSTSEKFVARAILGQRGTEITAALRVSSKKYRSDVVDNIIRRSVKAKHWPQGSNRQSIILHEFGHLLEYAYALKTNQLWVGNNVSPNWSKLLTTIRSGTLSATIKRETLANLQLPDTQETIKNGLSGYANTKPQEFLAEAFAEAEGTSNPRPIAREAIRILREKLKEVGL